MYVIINPFMLKQKIQNRTLSHLQSMLALLVVSVFATAVIVVPMVRADSLQSQINELQEENGDSHDKVDSLMLGAQNIEAAIQKLQARINELQAQIKANQAKSEKLKKEIIVAEQELKKQKDVLGQNIKAMYLEGEITTIEMLATSKDLSEFVDKQQYREVVRTKIKRQVDKITALRLELKAQRDEVEDLIKEDRQLREKVADQRAEQNRLLGLNETQQANFNSEIAKNNKKIQNLLNAQAALAAKLSSGVFVSLGPVRQGDVIGSVGNTGFSNGAHLHLEARSGNGLLNPNSFFGSKWIYPVDPVRVTQGYGVYNPIYISGYHPGIDFGGAGRPVKAVADGQIISRGCSADSSFFNTNAYGYAVVIQHNDGTFSVYAHMIPPSSGYGHCNFSTY